MSARWMPHLFSEENKRNGVIDFEALFFRRNADELQRRHVIVGEIE